MGEAQRWASLIVIICAGSTMGTKQGESKMIQFKLSNRTESLRPYLQELLLYSGISSATVEVGQERTRQDTIFIKEDECDNLEDVLAKFALAIYDERIHTKCLNSSVVSLMAKHGKSAEKIASVIERAIEPTSFFVLERYPIHAAHQNR